MAELEHDVREAFGMAIEKCAAKKLDPDEKKVAKSNAINKIVKEALDAKSAFAVDSTLFAKHCDRTSKTISLDVFMNNLLPDLARHNVAESLGAKASGANNPAVKEELNRIKKKISSKYHEWNGDKKGASSAVVDRLTNVKNYTGAHKSRFDADTGQGRGLAGRTEVNLGAQSGYVGNYKGAGTYDKTH